MPLRSCSAGLATALAGGVPLAEADLYQFTLADGVTNYYWTSWDVDLLVGAQIYSSKAPWLGRSKWNVTNTMEVPTMTVTMLANNAGFHGGPSIKAQIHNGLFDGAAFLYSVAFMTSFGNVNALGSVPIFGGVTAGIDVIGNQATMTCKGKNNLLDQYAPRNIYQGGCNHGFCDAGCTLSRATYTSTLTVGTAPSVTFIPWSGSAPSNYSNYIGGWASFTAGVAAGQRRTIAAASSSGLTLAYPLYVAPAAGDSFSASQGCDKTSNSGSGRSCSDRGNLQNYRGFEFVPPPNTAY